MLDVAHLKIDDEAPEVGAARRGRDGIDICPYSPIVVAITPSAPGSFKSVTTIWVE